MSSVPPNHRVSLNRVLLLGWKETDSHGLSCTDLDLLFSFVDSSIPFTIESYGNIGISGNAEPFARVSARYVSFADTIDPDVGHFDR
mgnify:CR=1 FL=1